MKKICAWCPTPHEMGDVAPLSDRRVTHGMCPEAVKREEAKVDQFVADRASAPDTLFLARHVAELLPIRDGDVTKPTDPDAPSHK